MADKKSDNHASHAGDPVEDPSKVMIPTPSALRKPFGFADEMAAGAYEEAIKSDMAIVQLEVVRIETEGAAIAYRNELVRSLKDPNNAQAVEKKLAGLQEAVAEAVALARKDDETLKGLDEKELAALKDVDEKKVAALIISMMEDQADQAKAAMVKDMRTSRDEGKKKGHGEEVGAGEKIVPSELPQKVAKTTKRGGDPKTHAV